MWSEVARNNNNESVINERLKESSGEKKAVKLNMIHLKRAPRLDQDIDIPSESKHMTVFEKSALDTNKILMHIR